MSVSHFAWRASALVLLAAAAALPTTGSAQVPGPLPLPQSIVEGPGWVSALVRQADGKVVVAGQFHYTNGGDGISLVRFNADGTLDPGWKATIGETNSRSTINAMAVDSTGRIYVGGNSPSISGSAYLARLNPDGTRDATWDPMVNYVVTALALDETGDNLYIGGSFSSVKQQAHQGLAKIPTAGNGTPDQTWTASASSYPFTMAVSNGYLYIGGPISTVNGVARDNLARITTSGSGTFDATWNPVVDSWVNVAQHDPISGKLLLGGFFGHVGGLERRGLARVAESGTGAVDVSWNPSVSLAAGNEYPYVYALLVDEANSRIYVGGSTTVVNSLFDKGLLARASLIGAGVADATFTALVDGQVNAIVPQPGGVYAGGRFAEAGGQLHESLARFDSNGTMDAAFAGRVTDNANAGVRAIAERGDVDETYIGGNFTRVNGAPHRGLAKFVGGILEESWQGAINKGYALALAIADDGALIAGGRFNQAGGQSRLNLARFARDDGALDTGFACEANGDVLALAAAGGTVYVAGNMSNVCATPRMFLAKLDDTFGSLDASWNPGADGFTDALALDASGLFVGGAFSNAGGAARKGLVKLARSGTGAADPTFNAAGGDGSYVRALALDPGGTVLYAGGQIPSFGGITRSGVARLDAATGALDQPWDPGFPANASVDNLVHDRHGGLIVEGLILSVGGQARSGLARVDAAGTGAVDLYWTPTITPVNNVQSIGLNAGGGLDVGGVFSLVSGVSRAAFARLPVATSIVAITSDSPDPSKYGQAYTPSAVLSASFAVPTGSVTFDDGAGNQCISPVVAGAASCSLSATPVGVHLVGATFAPDEEAFSSATDTAQHAVQKAATTLSVTGVPMSVPQGEVFTATPILSVTAPGGGSPSGSVLVKVDGQTVCTKSLSGPLGCDITLATSGSHSVTASYAGDTNFMASSASAVQVNATTESDLSVSIDDGVSIVVAGASVAYTVVAANGGPSAVSGSLVQVTAAPSLEGASWTCQASPGAQCPHASGSGNVFESVSLPSGATLTYTYGGVVPLSVGQSLTATASIGLPAATSDPDAADRTATDVDMRDGIFAHGFE